jgi:hypothetical protein
VIGVIVFDMGIRKVLDKDMLTGEKMRKGICLATAIVAMVFVNLPSNANDALAMSNRRGGTSIVISSRPNFICLPDQGFSISVGSPYDIISYDNRYYL